MSTDTKLPTIRIWQPPPADIAAADSVDPGELGPHLTLTRFYESWVLPRFRNLRGCSQETIEQDRDSLRLWAQYTGDPTLAEIGEATCELFVESLTLRCRPGTTQPISPNTIRKHCTHLQLMLDLAGPKTRRHRKTARLLADPPYLERPAARSKSPRDAFTFEEICTWLAGCELATDCRNTGTIPAAAWHRALILFCYNTGIRLGAALQATWSMLDRNHQGWISLPAEICKGGKQPQDVYVNRAAREALQSIRLPGQELLLPWVGYPESNSWLHRSRRLIQEAAGLPEHRRFGWHGLRKALGTWLAPRNWMLASIVLGHRGGNITRDHYVCPDTVGPLLEELPQPVATTPKRRASDRAG
ncbi:MAG: tyrosine-type recombinase/integrase [Planctomycetota bacterium]